MKTRIFKKIGQFFSCLVLYNFTLLCYLGYLDSNNVMLSLVLMVATVLWFYSFVIDLLHLFEFLKDKE